MGSNTADLRGRFIRGHGRNSGSLGAVQYEEIESHSHSETRFNGSDDSGSGNVHGADDIVATSYTGWSGIEARPKNYSVIYIIKAE